jgi:hypothetical protein
MAADTVLNRHDRADRVLDAVVGDGGDADADVVPGDDALRFDRQRDDPQRDPTDPIDQRDDEDRAGPAGAVPDATQPKLHGPLVLLDYVEEANHLNPFLIGRTPPLRASSHLDVAVAVAIKRRAESPPHWRGL